MAMLLIEEKAEEPEIKKTGRKDKGKKKEVEKKVERQYEFYDLYACY